MMGCAEPRLDHSTRHNEDNPLHCIQLNVATWRAWCYICDTELILTKNTPSIKGILGTRSLKSSFSRPPESETKQDDRVGGLVGLYNLGNTCYMNAAIQCMSNIPVLSNFFLECPDLIPRDLKPNLSLAYRNLMTKIWNSSVSRSLEPTSVLHAIKSVFPAFRGFQQHDSQEFLRCLIDQLHKELSEPIFCDDDEDETKTEDSDQMESLSELDSNASASSEHSEEFETASERSSHINRKRKHDEMLDKDSGLGSYSSMTRLPESEISNLSNKQVSSCTNLSDQEYLDATSDTGSGPASPLLAPEPGLELRYHKPRRYRSIITDVFDGKLVSSVKCLACDRISKTTETFQDLSLPIPSQEALSTLRQRPPVVPEEEDGWLFWMWKWVASWFYGPDVTLQDCLAFFFSEDELKGDNMYSCEKCKKLRNGLKFSQVIELPDTLCVHLKRFRHDFAFSSKISARVAFPLTGLDLAQWIHKDCISTQTVYDLSGIICHHGTAGGGHYTSYCCNPENGNWYHFDDSTVTQVDQSVVAGAEAYVLFYRKSSCNILSLRRELSLMDIETSDSLVKYYLSKSWLVKFQTMAEPGEIDNSSVFCRHGGVRPQRIESAESLSKPMPPLAWRTLYQRFGGSAAITSLKPCQVCMEAARAEERQRQFELSEFQLLREHEKADMTGSGDSYLLVTSWFSIWEAWVLGKAREPPGPINNRSLYVQRGNSFALRPHVDHFKLSEDIWSLFLSLYSGGPEVVLRSGGGLRVSSPRPARITNIAARLRERCRVSESK